MALIECNECKNMVSENAQTCPHCGNPIAKVQNPLSQVNTLDKNRLSLFAYLVASLLIIIAPLLPNRMYVANGQVQESQNMINMFFIPRSGENKAFILFAFIIIVLGILGLLVSIKHVKSKLPLSNKYLVLPPIFAVLSYVLYEFVGLSDFKDNCVKMAETINEVIASGGFADDHYTLGIGMFIMIIAFILYSFSVFIILKASQPLSDKNN